MSETSVKARAAMKAKAARMGGAGDPREKCDASSWTPPPPMETSAPTGPRPVSKRRNYKSGGHVEGAEAVRHAGKRPRRKDGGKALVRDWENADVKEANEDREGIKHEGGMKTGGRAKRANGGLSTLAGILPGALASGPGADIPTSRFNFQNGPSLASKAAGLKRGGKAEHPKGCRCKECMGGRVERAKGGGLYESQFSNHDGGRDPRAAGGEVSKPIGYHVLDRQGNVLGRFKNGPAASAMVDRKDNAYGAYAHTRRPIYDQADYGARHKNDYTARASGGKLNAKERKDMPKSEFGEPGSRKYPMPDKSHAANAKARASEMEHKGKLSKSTEEKIDAKADKVLARKNGGSAGKGKMSVNIVIAPGGQHPQAAAPPPMPAGPMPPPPRPAMPPPGPPPGMGAGPPPGMMPPGAMPPPPMRKRGGLVEGGAGGGLGRLEKIKDYGDEARKLDGHY